MLVHKPPQENADIFLDNGSVHGLLVLVIVIQRKVGFAYSRIYGAVFVIRIQVDVNVKYDILILLPFF